MLVLCTSSSQHLHIHLHNCSCQYDQILLRFLSILVPFLCQISSHGGDLCWARLWYLLYWLEKIFFNVKFVLTPWQMSMIVLIYLLSRSWLDSDKRRGCSTQQKKQIKICLFKSWIPNLLPHAQSNTFYKPNMNEIQFNEELICKNVLTVKVICQGLVPTRTTNTHTSISISSHLT